MNIIWTQTKNVSNNNNFNNNNNNKLLHACMYMRTLILAVMHSALKFYFFNDKYNVCSTIFSILYCYTPVVGSWLETDPDVFEVILSLLSSTILYHITGYTSIESGMDVCTCNMCLYIIMNIK